MPQPKNNQSWLLLLTGTYTLQSLLIQPAKSVRQNKRPGNILSVIASIQNQSETHIIYKAKLSNIIGKYTNDSCDELLSDQGNFTQIILDCSDGLVLNLFLMMT